MATSVRERSPSPPILSWAELHPEKAAQLPGGAHFQLQAPPYCLPQPAPQLVVGPPLVLVGWLPHLPLTDIAQKSPESPVGSGLQGEYAQCPPGSASNGFLPEAAQASTASTASSDKEAAGRPDDPDSKNRAPGKPALNKPKASTSHQILQQPVKYELAPEASAEGNFIRSKIYLHSPVESQEPEHPIGQIEGWLAAGAADATVEVKARCVLRVDRCCERGYFPNSGTQVQLLEQFLVQAMGTKNLSSHRHARKHTTLRQACRILEGWLQTRDDQEVRLIFQACFVEDEAAERRALGADINASPSQQELINVAVDDDAFKKLRESSIDSSRYRRTSWSLRGTKEGFRQLSDFVVRHIRKDASPLGTLRESDDGKKLKYDLPILDQQLPRYLPGCICYVRSLRRERANDQRNPLKLLHNQAVVLLEDPQITGDENGRCRVGRWIEGYQKKAYKIRPENLFVGAMTGTTLEEELAKVRFWDVYCFMDETGTAVRTAVTLLPPEMNKDGVWDGQCRVQIAGDQIGCKNIILVEPGSIRFDPELARVKPSRGKNHTASEAQRSAITECSEQSRTNAPNCSRAVGLASKPQNVTEAVCI